MNRQETIPVQPDSAFFMASTLLSGFADSISQSGFSIVTDVVSAIDVLELRSTIERIPDGDVVRKKRSVYGVQNLLETSPDICRLATRPELWRYVTAVLGENAFACRAIFFNKTPDANWVLGYHQDSVISVTAKIETPGYFAWGQKAGVWQVQPPAEIMSRMLALRVHLDDCGVENGALRVLPGSHRHGWVEDNIAEWKQRVPEVVCAVTQGGLVTMRPLILHASSKALSPTNRRVIHLEYAAEHLPNGLQWSRQIRPM